MAAQVFFADARSRNTKTSGVGKLARLLERLPLSSTFSKDELVAIKLHFGELGNDAFVSPVFARVVVDAIKATGAKPFLADTNTLYTGSRSNSVDHAETAVLHGFDWAVCGAPVVIADGLRGDNWREVELGAKWFKSVKIAGDFAAADGLLALSHFKGHEMAGFGGALKNLAMGCAPPAGKRDQHSVHFFVREAKCVGCGVCVPVCPAKAITMADRKAVIARDRCIGCGECAPRCAARAITMDWSAELPEFTEKMVEYAAGALKGKEGKLVFVTFVTDVVPDCDCTPWADQPVVPDIGILVSTDPVAIDQAAYDLVKAAPVMAGSALEGKGGPGDDKFALLHPDTRGLLQLEYASALGMGSREYELIRI